MHRCIHDVDSFLCRCILPTDDPYRECFDCDNIVDDTQDDKSFGPQIDRIAGEVFETTGQRRRVICGLRPLGGTRCRLRIDRDMQLRRLSYVRVLQFI